MSLFEHFFLKVLSLYFEARIRIRKGGIRIRVKGTSRIRFKGKGRVRIQIRIKVMRSAKLVLGTVRDHLPIGTRYHYLNFKFCVYSKVQIPNQDLNGSVLTLTKEGPMCRPNTSVADPPLSLQRFL
jgi:hypothetical protein